MGKTMLAERLATLLHRLGECVALQRDALASSAQKVSSAPRRAR